MEIQKSTCTSIKNVRVSKLLKWDATRKRKTTPAFKGWGRYSQTWALKTPPSPPPPSVFKHPQRPYRPRSCALKTALGYCATPLAGELFGCLGDLKRTAAFTQRTGTSIQRAIHKKKKIPAYAELLSFANAASIHWRVRDSHCLRTHFPTLICN